MKNTYIVATVATVAALAALGLMNQSAPQGSFLSGTVITEQEHAFIQFIAKHRRHYGTKEEYETRLTKFAEKYDAVKEHNSGDNKFKLAINKFADYNDSERKELTGWVDMNTDKDYVYFDENSSSTDVDWVTEGAVTGIKNQGSCGGCWAFSTTGNIEGINYINNNELVSLSEQQIIDCSKYNLGCNGGNVNLAILYVADNHDLELESDYPFTGTTDTCAYDSDKGEVAVSSYKNVQSESVSQLQSALEQQPISVAIEADKDVFQLYSSGVLDSSKCGTSLDHAVLVVGNGSEDGTDYWLVKNSWGTDWGLDGYIKIAKVDGEGICGIQIEPSYAIQN